MSDRVHRLWYLDDLDAVAVVRAVNTDGKPVGRFAPCDKFANAFELGAIVADTIDAIDGSKEHLICIVAEHDYNAQPDDQKDEPELLAISFCPFCGAQLEVLSGDRYNRQGPTGVVRIDGEVGLQ